MTTLAIANEAHAAMGIIMAIVPFVLILFILNIIDAWKVFTKASEKGWKLFVPFCSTYATFKISWENVRMF